MKHKKQSHEEPGPPIHWSEYSCNGQYKMACVQVLRTTEKFMFSVIDELGIPDESPELACLRALKYIAKEKRR